MNHRQIMQAKYPSANLVLYFTFIELCRQHEPEPQTGRTHSQEQF